RQEAEGDAERHRGEDPQREVAVEERELAGDAGLRGLLVGHGWLVSVKRRLGLRPSIVDKRYKRRAKSITGPPRASGAGAARAARCSSRRAARRRRPG